MLAEGMSLREVCRQKGMPSHGTVLNWRMAHDDFADQYARAREIGYEIMADEILEIADDGRNDWMERQLGEDGPTFFAPNHEHISRSRLRSDTRKWLLSKCLPKVYGDKVDHKVSGDPDNPIVIEGAADAFIGRISSIATRSQTERADKKPNGRGGV